MPALTGSFGSHVHNGLACAFSNTTADGQSSCTHHLVAHAVVVVLDVRDMSIEFRELLCSFDVAAMEPQMAYDRIDGLVAGFKVSAPVLKSPNAVVVPDEFEGLASTSLRVVVASLISARPNVRQAA